MSFKKDALNYHQRGFAVIRFRPKGKIPSIDWREYQHKLPTKEEIERWFKERPLSNLGIITGKISGIVVIDFDTKEAYQNAIVRGLPDTPTVITGRGYHVYCKYKEGVRNFSKKAGLPDIDLRGEGGCIVAPPSIHENGKSYQWMEGKSLDDLPLGDVPEWVLIKSEGEKTPLTKLYEGVAEGDRNNSLARLVGYWANGGLNNGECLKRALLWNSKNFPPLPTDEVENVVRSIYDKHHREKKEKAVEVVESVEVNSSNIFPSINFPIDVFPPPIQELIFNCNKSYKISTDVVSAIVLTLLSTSIGNSIRVSDKEDSKEPVFLWLIIIGNSGSGKSPCLNKLLEPFHHVEAIARKNFKERFKKYEHDLLLYKQGLKDTTKENSEHTVKPTKPLETQYITSDITVEALAELMKASPRGVLINRDELAGFFKSFDQYRPGNDQEKYSELWNCQPWYIKRILRGSIDVLNTGCSIIGGIQPKVLSSIFKERDFNSGFIPRFLFCNMKEFFKKHDNFSLTKEDVKIWDEFIMRGYIYRLEQDDLGINKHTIFSFDEEASKWFINFLNEYEEKRRCFEGKESLFVPKFRNYLLRIIGILHFFNREGSLIDVGTVKDSIRVINYFAGQ